MIYWIMVKNSSEYSFEDMTSYRNDPIYSTVVSSHDISILNLGVTLNKIDQKQDATLKNLLTNWIVLQFYEQEYVFLDNFV